jgi:hypothetical protein
MKALTINTARTFLSNYRQIRDPHSLSYNDNYCGAWLNDQTRSPRHGRRSSAARTRSAGGKRKKGLAVIWVLLRNHDRQEMTSPLSMIEGWA